MKKLLFFAAMIMIYIISCTKASPNQNNNNNGNNNNNNGGNNGGNNHGLTITSITPTHPYPDDTITITGTGFNPDKSKDSVEFGKVSATGPFHSWYDGAEEDWASTTILIEATSTKLVIKAKNPYPLDYKAFYRLVSSPTDPSPPSIAGVRVLTGGKQVQSAPIPFKRHMELRRITYVKTGGETGRPNDSLLIIGDGFDTTGVTFSIGGKVIVPEKITHHYNLYTASFHMPRDFFGYQLDENATEIKTVSVRNKDGREEKHDYPFYLSPIMVITSAKTGSANYKKSTGGTIVMTVKGTCLKDDAMVYVASPNGTHFSFSLGAAQFSDEAPVNIASASGLNPGYYKVLIKRGDRTYGGCNFYIDP